MTTSSNKDFGYEKKHKPKMKDFIEPTKQYIIEVKEISDRIEKKLEFISKEMTAFKDAFNEIKEKHMDGMSMSEIKESYVKEQEQNEINDIEDEILDLFSKKLKSLKQNLTT